MQLRIRHTTGYTYDSGAAASYNEARMTPLTTPGQYVLHTRLDIAPEPWSYVYQDYWGSTVTTFELHERHNGLRVVSTSLVETSRTESEHDGLAWEDLAACRDEQIELLGIDSWVEPAPELAEAVARLRAAAPTPGAYALDVCKLIHSQVEYVPGSTEVTTTAADAWNAKAGVCQDMAHLTIGCLRREGIPARYVSGYLHPSDEPEIGQTVEGESHAWVEWWDGEWVGFDPTNEVFPGDRHVMVARGRNYADCPPLRGIFSTAGGSELFVGVEITRTR
ncbi:MAG: transglutaminase family protein [Aeromicrobium sp.]